MKTILLSVCLAIFAVFTVEAQGETAYPPIHPMDTRIGDKDPFFIKIVSYIDSIQPIWTGGYVEHKWNLEGYTDTVYGGMTSSISYYSKENNKLIRMDDYAGPIEAGVFHTITFFTYDNQGRQTTQTMTSYTYDLDGSLIEKEDSVVFDYDFSTVIYTDSSYFWGDTEYIFDKQDRLIQIKIRPENEHLHRNIDYTYFEDKKGYSEFSYKTTDPPISEIRYKEEYYFDDKGLATNSRVYSQYYKDGEWSDWWLAQNWYDNYTFYDDITSNRLTTIKSHQIYGVKGGISIHLTQPEQVSIYTINGQLLGKYAVSDYLKVDFPKGLYIVTAGKEAYKVSVR